MPAAAPAALSQIQNIQKLSIDIRLITGLQHFNVPIPLFNKMNCLTICNWEHCFADFHPDYFLARGVVLETLVFDVSPTFDGWSQSLLNIPADNLQESRLGPLLNHLKTIEFQLVRSISQAEYLMEVIEFFLKNAKVLEELKVTSRHGSSEQQVEIGRKLTNFPTASEKCRVSFDTLK